MEDKLTTGKVIALIEALGGSGGSVGPKGDPGVGFDSTTQIDLGHGSQTATITSDGILLSNQTRVTTDATNYDITSTHLIPMASGDGISLQANVSGDKVIVKQNMVLIGADAPTTNTQGFVGQFYLDMSESELYHCTDITEEGGSHIYTWKKIGAEGSSQGVVEISTTGDSGSFNTATMASILDNTVNTVIVNDNKRYYFVDDATSFRTFVNINTPLATQVDFTAIYVNTSPEALNYGSWSKESVTPTTTTSTVEVIDIGNGQVTIDGTIFPTMPVAKAQEIYDKIMENKTVRCKWSFTIPYEFNIVGIKANDYKLVALVHDRIVTYEWTSQTTADISPSIKERHIHTININETTAYGSWNYQFSFMNDTPIEYTQLSAVGHYLYENYVGIRVPATGMCVHNSEKYFIVDVYSETDNMVTVEMYKVADGTFNSISTGVIGVTDFVQ